MLVMRARVKGPFLMTAIWAMSRSKRWLCGLFSLMAVLNIAWWLRKNLAWWLWWIKQACRPWRLERMLSLLLCALLFLLVFLCMLVCISWSGRLNGTYKQCWTDAIARKGLAFHTAFCVGVGDLWRKWLDARSDWIGKSIVWISFCEGLMLSPVLDVYVRVNGCSMNTVYVFDLVHCI